MIIQDTRMTRFMQAADMFERWKVIGITVLCPIDLEQEPTKELVTKMVENLKSYYESNKDYAIVAIVFLACHKFMW